MSDAVSGVTKAESKNAPKMPGMYFAYRGKGGRANRKEYWTYIVRVSGEFPFFELCAWDLKKGETQKDFDARFITQWSDRIHLCMSGNSED